MKGSLFSNKQLSCGNSSKEKNPSPQRNVAREFGKARGKISEKRKAALKRIEVSFSEDFEVKMAVIEGKVTACDVHRAMRVIVATRDLSNSLQIERKFI